MTDKKPRVITNIYELWFEFLKRHEGYRQCCAQGGSGEYAALYADFGDVHGQMFGDWWEDHHELFETMEFTAYRTRDLSDVASYIDDDDNMVVIVNFYAPRQELKRAFSKLLEEHHPNGKSGRRNRDDVVAEYKLYGVGMRPELGRRIEYLNKVLWTYDWRKPVKTMKLYEIADELELGESLDPDDMSDRLNLTAAASRLMRHATQIIENVGSGIFPKHS